MNTNWSKVVIAAFFEVLWVIGLNHANSFVAWIGTALRFSLAFI